MTNTKNTDDPDGDRLEHAAYLAERAAMATRAAPMAPGHIWHVDAGGKLVAENQSQTYRWRTDGASGSVDAASIDDAIAKLVSEKEWPSDRDVRDGGWGWVESTSGERETIGEVP
jgi:hypothetical protein